jgi:CRISPR/Cas system CSM-associated protein Csm3 (group 7 of RAMP superfamily)
MNDIEMIKRPKPRYLQNRNLTHRIVITGVLTLLSPARFGGGSQSDLLTDMPVLRDSKEGVPLIPGASIAGAMRAYCREWETGYRKPVTNDSELRFQRLFGQIFEEKTRGEISSESRESFLIVEDARAETLRTEFRPGVKIDPKTRMVKQEEKGGQLFDMELLEAGTAFKIRMVLLLPADKARQKELKEALAVALTGFERGEIGLGARKSRGFGACVVDQWHVESINLSKPKELIGWLKGNHADEKETDETIQPKQPAEKLLAVKLPEDQRRRFELHARFRLKTTLLIGSGGVDPDAPDIVHITSQRNGSQMPVLPGTSVAGAVRARALRIARILDSSHAESLIEQIFGTEIAKQQAKRGDVKASRIVFHESEVKGMNDLVQTRIKIDRFTGGAFPGALFQQQPVFGGKNSLITLDIQLKEPQPEDIGLLLLILKDLWTGDLPLGGEASIGRGRLSGIGADLDFHSPSPNESGHWEIRSSGWENEKEVLEIKGDRERLESYVKALRSGGK